jgi:SAM-dependent methyltransferase
LDLRNLRSNWDLFAEKDPLFAVVSWPEKRGRRWDEGSFFANGRDEIRGVMAYLKGLPVRCGRRRALDFGCGVGRLTRPLAGHFRRVTGVDVSPRMVALARGYARRERRCDFLVNEASDLGLFRDGTFDFVYSNITLQHLSPSLALAYIREFVRILAPGGVAVFQLPSAHIPSTAGGRLRALARSVLPPLLLSCYRWLQRALLGNPVVTMNAVPRERVLEALRAAGAEIVDLREDPNAGPEWPGYRYCVRKPPARRRPAP